MIKRESISKFYVVILSVFVALLASVLVSEPAQAAKKKYDIQIKSKVSMYSEATGQIKGKITVPKGVSKKVLYSSSNKKEATFNSAG